MTTAIVAASSALLVVLLTLALAREIKLRRALQRLLAKLLKFWRNHDPPIRPDSDDPDSDRL